MSLVHSSLCATKSPHTMSCGTSFRAARLAVSGGAPDGSTAIKALTLSGAASAALKPKLPPWLWTKITHGQTLATSALYAACVLASLLNAWFGL